jgi:hypothetical protein
MANYLISPGVITNEIDQSQYAATTSGTGNIAALIGYAEKGPFTPTLVTSKQDFNQTFGYTLKDAPYLAQGAYEYFNQGSQLLVVRAGDSRDPLAFPNAAQNASKVIRVNPSTTTTAGSQSFKITTDLAAGSFAAGAQYSFNIVADFRAFTTPQYVETWGGLAVETATNLYGQTGGPTTPSPYVPISTIDNPTFKIAMTPDPSNQNLINSFVADFKRNQNAPAPATGGLSAEYYGTGGTRNGTTLGSTARITLQQYRHGGNVGGVTDVYQEVVTDFIAISGTYGAAVIGTSAFAAHDWTSTNGSFILNGTTIVVNTNWSTVDAAIAELNGAGALGAGTGKLPLGYFVKALIKTAGNVYVCLMRQTGAIGTSMTLASPLSGADVLGFFGWRAGTYNDSDGIYGTWHAEYPQVILIGTLSTGPNPSTFDGFFVFNKQSSATVNSFEASAPAILTAPPSGSWSMTNLVSAIQAALDNLYPSYFDPKSRATVAQDLTSGKITITANGQASSTFASIVSITAPSSGNSLISLLNGTDPPISGLPPGGVGQGLITLMAAEKGSYGNELIFRVQTQTINVGQTTLTYNNVFVLWNGKQVSAYPKIIWTDLTATNYIGTVMANDAYITFTSEDEDGDTIPVQLPDGDWVLGTGDLPNGVDSSTALIVSYTVGSNGWALDTNGAIQSMSGDFANALQLISNPEVYSFNLVAAPGGADPIVQIAVQNLCESRHDVFGVIDAAPFGLGMNQPVDVTQVNADCSSLTSSYVGAFWPWVYNYDSDNQQYVWLPPSIYALEAMVYTDNISNPWFAPAGTTRGVVSAINIEYSPSTTERDILYGGTAIVNSLVKFVNQGIVIWGQKTAQRTDSATNRINVRRLLIYAEKLIATMARGFLFEPDDSTNWAAFARQANAILEPIRQGRGLTQYTVVCDATTNTAATIAQNLMVGKIFVQPTQTTEFIEVDFTINAATGATTVSG